MVGTKSTAAKHDADVEEWHKLLKRCLRDNTSFDAFETEVLRLMLRTPLDGPGVLTAWAAAHDGGFTVRPRQVKYFEKLQQLRLFSHADVLQRITASLPVTVFSADRFLIKAGAAKGEYRQCLEAVMLERITYHLLHLRTGKGASKDRTINFRSQRPLMALVDAFVQAITAVNILQGPALAIGRELGKYVGVFINDMFITGILSSENGAAPKALKRSYGRALPQFISILNNGAEDVAQSLALIQQQSGLYERANTDTANDDMADSLNAIAFQQGVVDPPPVITRAALYVFLNAMLSGRPMCDDPMLFTFLNSRYNGAVDNLVVDLVTASFDVLANAINRTEPTESINIYRSFLINKVPVLLESYQHMLYPPLTIEMCITNAVRTTDPSADPFSNQAFDLLSSSGMLFEARQEFLFACALYGLLPESSIETILGEVPMQNLPESGKYNRTDLVAQCTANPARIEELVNELENFEGQAAEITAALVQIIRDCCAGKDSITLKGICNTLSRKMNTLDVMLLFEEPKSILQPMCELLDSWLDTEEHSEYHPVYDEFSSIFLLVLVFRQRFDLQLSDMGITSTDSFIRKYIVSGLTPLNASELSEEQQKQLAGWIKGLYDSDGNLSDEPMSTCGPKSFHLLVATLFDQSLKANQAGIIPFTALQGGLGYFLEPFLLPALVTGLGWAARRLWETQATAPHLDRLVPLLAGFVRPGALSPEAKTLHEAVLATAAGPLERALAHVQKLHPRRTDLEPLRSALAPRVPPARIGAHASPSEMEGWATGTPGGFVPGLRHALRALVAWSATAPTATSTSSNASVTPPQYTHRQVAHAVRTLGAPATLGAFLDEARRLIDGVPLPAAAASGAGAHGTGGTGGGPTATPAPAGGPTSAPTVGASGTTPATGVVAGTGMSRTFAPALVLDVLASIFVSPVAQAPRGTLTLRGALDLANADAFALSKRGTAEHARAETIVRLYRRVGALVLHSDTLPAGNNGSGGGPNVAGAGVHVGVGVGGSAADGDILMQGVTDGGVGAIGNKVPQKTMDQGPKDEGLSLEMDLGGGDLLDMDAW